MPFDLALLPGNLGEGGTSPLSQVVNPSPCRCDGVEQGVAGFGLQDSRCYGRRVYDALDGREADSLGRSDGISAVAAFAATAGSYLLAAGHSKPCFKLLGDTERVHGVGAASLNLTVAQQTTSSLRSVIGV